MYSGMNTEQHRKLALNPPPHLKSVDALPCKIWMLNCTTLQHVI